VKREKEVPLEKQKRAFHTWCSLEVLPILLERRGEGIQRKGYYHPRTMGGSKGPGYEIGAAN